jgi:hypothetical protein
MARVYASAGAAPARYTLSVRVQLDLRSWMTATLAGGLAVSSTACAPATTRALIERHQLADALGAARDRPEERDAVVGALVDGLRLRIIVEVMPGDMIARTLGADAPVLATQALVKVRVASNHLQDLDVRTAWKWNGIEGVEPSFYALAGLTGERRELSAAEKLVDLGRASVLAASCGLSVGTVCPAQALGQSNASKYAPTEAAAPKAARMAHALERSGFVLVPAGRSGQPVQLSVDVDVDARLCETPPCGSLRLVASMEVAASDLALSAGNERVFARERVVVQP